MEKVRTTMRPDEEIEVSAAEAKDLRRMGMLRDDALRAKKNPADQLSNMGPDKLADRTASATGDK